MSSNLSSCLFVYTEHLHLGISKHIGSKILSSEVRPSDETPQKHPLRIVQVIFRGCLAGLGMTPPKPQHACIECLLQWDFF